jgi:hypothetical protein
VGNLDSDEIKADLKGGKYQSAFEGGENLIGYKEEESKAFFYTNGSVEMKLKVPAAGEYTLKVRASCQASNKENAKMTILAGEKAVAEDFALTQEDEKDYTFAVKLGAGEQKITVSFTNDEYKEGEYDRNMYLHEVSLKKKQK